MGLCTALTVLFVGLKLGNIIAWNWFWVIFPVLIPFLLILGATAIAILVVIVDILRK